MRKIFLLLLCVSLILSARLFSFSAAAEPILQKVTAEAPSDPIEVNPGDKNVEITWTLTENEGWGAFKVYLEFDGDVFSFVPGGEKLYSETGEGTFDVYKGSMPKRGLVMTVVPNIFGLNESADPAITKDCSSFLFVANGPENDITATGDFFTIYLNIADDAPGGDYEITITADPENQSSFKGKDVAVPVVTFSTATVHVTGPEKEPTDDRLTSEGVQIRVPAFGSKLPTQGFRFVNTITRTLYDELAAEGALPQSPEDKGVGFGTVVIPTSMLDGAALTKETPKAAVVPAVLLYEAPDDSVARYTACITDIPEVNYEKEYTAVPYVTRLVDGEEVTVYGEPMTASVFETAKAAVADAKLTEYAREYLYNNILSVVDPETYPEDRYSDFYRP